MARTQGHGNPHWTREETILALDLYNRLEKRIPGETDQKVIELSETLNNLPWHAETGRRERFRNPAGVSFKLQNLRAVETGKGLKNVSRIDREIMAELGAQPQQVRATASLLLQALHLVKSDPLPALLEVDSEIEFSEGRLITAIHIRRERDRRVRKALIDLRRVQGSLLCELCMWRRPNAEGYDIAALEAHHLLPLAMVVQEKKTTLNDFALLCANCHRLTHRAIALERRWLQILELRTLLFGR